MHPTSLMKMRAFRDTYLSTAPEGTLRVLDLGAAAYDTSMSYRSLFPAPRYEYVGVDMVGGDNVDIVVADPHDWREVASSSVDVVVSGQMLEHDPYFWVTMCEVARVLRPGGWCCIIAPSRGPAHFFPSDCWRFYPDSGAALMTFAGLEPVETWVEPATFRTRRGVEWGDMLAIGRLATMSRAELTAHHERLAAIVAASPAMPESRDRATPGPAVARYTRAARTAPWQWRPYLYRKAVSHLGMKVFNSAPPKWRERLSRLR